MIVAKEEIVKAITKEFDAACKNYPKYASPHEAYAVLLEEVDEATEKLTSIRRELEIMWGSIKRNEEINGTLNVIEKEAEQLAAEACQVAAVAVKEVISETKNRVKRNDDIEKCDYSPTIIQLRELIAIIKGRKTAAEDDDVKEMYSRDIIALDMAIKALKEKAEREKHIKEYGAEIARNTKRRAIAYMEEYKGKYGTEYIATIYYEVKEDFVYLEGYQPFLMFPPRVVHVKASNVHRLKKKIVKTIQRLDAEVIAIKTEREE